MIKFSRAGQRDLPGIWQIELKGFEYPMTHQTLQGSLDSPEVYPIIGKLSNMIISWALTAPGDRTGEVEILRLAIHPAFRRRNFGTQTIHHMVKELRAGHQKGKLLLTVPEYQMDVNDPDTVNDFFWRNGFVATKTVKDHFHFYGRQYDGVVLERKVV